MAYTFHQIREEACRALGITGRPRQAHTQTIEDRENEIEINMRKRSKLAGERIARHMRRIIRIKEDETISEQIKNNAIQEKKSEIMKESQHISERMKNHVFNNIIDDTSINSIIENIEQRDGILNYLETDEDERIRECENKRKQLLEKKMQELY